MNRYTLILTFLLSLISFPMLGKDFEGLVKRDGLYYERSSDTPYTGTVTGKKKGYMYNGEKDGEWTFYYDDDVLKAKGTYKHGKQDGNFTVYHDNSQILYQGNYSKGKKEGHFDFYYKDGTINEHKSGTYENGKKISD